MSILNHRTFYHMILGGAAEIIAMEKELNALNVFPVPDGDTGSNLAHLMRMIVRETRWSEPSTQMLQSMKEACLFGARGNSGMIFSQFIISMCDYLTANPSPIKAQFLEMCEHSAAMSRRSVREPQEGTVLTVMKDWVGAMKEASDPAEGLRSMLQRSLARVHLSLENTKLQLAVLRKHNIVDAGAKGFVHFLQGFIASLNDDSEAAAPVAECGNPPVPRTGAVDNTFHDLADPLEYRYCTEFLFDIRTDLEQIKMSVAALGNSVVAVGDNSQGKIHMHTDDPSRVAEAIQRHGWIVHPKVDDMKRQYEMIYSRQASIALVVDSACDIPEPWLDDYQIHRLPLLLQLGRSTYLDKVTLQSDAFYDKLERVSERPTTSQPAPETIELLYERLLAHYDHIVSIHVSKRLSGTYDACRQAAERIDPARIHVFDSRTLSGAYGLLVHRAGEAIQSGKSLEELREWLTSSILRTEIVVSVPTLKHMIRGGRVSPLQGKIASWLDMKPIVSVDREGRSMLYGKTFFKRSNLDKMLRMVSDLHRRNPIQSYVILHAEAAEESGHCAAVMTRITGQKPLYVTAVSPVIGLHAGKGAVSVAMMLRNENRRGSRKCGSCMESARLPY